MALLGIRWKPFLSLGLVFALFFLTGPAEAQDDASVDGAEVAGYTLGETGDTLLAEAAGDTLEETGDSLAAGAGFTDTEESKSFFGKIASSGMVDKFHEGGVFMWPLLILSVVGLAVFFERFFTFSKARINVRKFMSEIGTAMQKDGIEGSKHVCERTRGPISAVLHAGLMKAGRGTEAIEKAVESAGTVEMSFLEKGLVVISSVATVGPLVGFLGTVAGMIHAFEAIAAADQVNAKVVASGISEALITTATGLMIAIPAQIAYNYFVAQIDRFIIEMEEASTEMIDSLIRLEGGE